MKALFNIFFILMPFCVFSQNATYPQIENNSMVLAGDKCGWDADAVHTFSIVEANLDGYKYYGYYALDHYEKDPHIRKGGLARSNDLMNWEKYDHNPIILSNCRCPQHGTIENLSCNRPCSG